MTFYATAIVTMTVVIQPEDRWAEDVTLSQVNKQARESALLRLRNKLRDAGVEVRSSEVKTIIVEEVK